jgi:phenylpropionate dioxygenase-like ring-hydroxylating dioxygenase large terminal subunit
VNVQASSFRAFEEDIAGLGTDPIPTGPYYREDYFELEREAIFKRTWLNVGHICELPEPGTFIVRELEFARASILITHGKDGKLRAFHNVCPHRGTQLVSEEGGAKSSFTCRYHAWTFSYDGKLRSAPDFERFYVEQDQCGLRPVSVDVCAGLIFLNLDPAPQQTLREFLGPLPERLENLPVAKATTFSEYVYEIDANWKVTFDNFEEVYHLRFIHPRTGAAAGGPENPFGYPVKYNFYGPHRGHTFWKNPSPSFSQHQLVAFGKMFEGVVAEGFAEAPENNEYFALFPNLFILGQPAQHFFHSVMPISATRSRGVIRLYWVGKDDSASKRFAREFSMVGARDVHAEDVEVIEAGQRGLSSGALEHMHFQSQEVLLRHLFRNVDDRVQAYKASLQAAGEVA